MTVRKFGDIIQQKTCRNTDTEAFRLYILPGTGVGHFVNVPHQDALIIQQEVCHSSIKTPRNGRDRQNDSKRYSHFSMPFLAKTMSHNKLERFKNVSKFL